MTKSNNTQQSSESVDFNDLGLIHDAVFYLFDKETPSGIRYYLQKVGFMLMKSNEYCTDPQRDEIADTLSALHEFVCDLDSGMGKEELTILASKEMVAA